MAERLDFLKGVTKLHAFYTEQVRMLAHAYGLQDTEAATLLDQYGYFNVARSILNPPRVDVDEMHWPGDGANFDLDTSPDSDAGSQT